MTLRADIWDNDYDSPTHLLRLGQVSGLGVTWGLPGGLLQAGVTVYEPGAGAYRIYKKHVGMRLIVSDGFCYRPIVDARITAPTLYDDEVGLAADGPIWDLEGDYEATAPGSSDTTSDAIKTALTDHAQFLSSDLRAVCATTVPAEGINIPIEGLTLRRYIEEMLRGGDGNGYGLVFWIEPAPFDDLGKPQKPVAKMTSLSPILASRSDLDWQVWQRDKVRGSEQISRDIRDLATRTAATYRNPDYVWDSEQGTLSYEASNLELKDTGQDFGDWEMAGGDGQAVYMVKIVNTNDSECEAYLGAKTSATQIKCYKDRMLTEAGFTGAKPNSKTPETYRILRVDGQAITGWATNNASTYWTRSKAVSASGLSTAAAAEAVRDAELERLSNPQLRQTFTIGSREIRDGAGYSWPLWHMLVGGGYLRDNEVGPDDGLFDLGMDYLRVGRITSLRYDHSRRQMQVGLGEDPGLDTLLSKFGYNYRLLDQLGRTLIPLYG